MAKGKKTGGRQKGSLNKTTKEVKNAILNVFDPDEFQTWAKENPGLFFTQVLTKVLPRDVAADIGGTVTIKYSGWDDKNNSAK